MGLVCLLLNIVLPLAMSLLVVGIGGIIYGAVQKERMFLRNGITQLAISLSWMLVGPCLLFFFLSSSMSGGGITADSPFQVILPSMAFLLSLPLAMYIWSVFDAVKIYRHSRSAN